MFLTALIFFGSVFWMKNTVDFFCWSVIEITAAILMIRLFVNKKILYAPDKKITLALLLFALWVCFSLIWSANFHATLTALYKIIFALIMIVIFSNEPGQWKHAINRCVILLSLLFALSIGMIALFFPSLYVWSKMHYPNLFCGFLAAGGILSCAQGMESIKSKKILFLSISVVLGLCLIFFASLAPMISYLLGIILLLFISGKINSKVWIYFSLCLAGVICFFYIIGKSEYLYSIWSRKTNDPFAFERVRIWKDSFQYFLDHPILGTGLGTFRDYYPQYKTIEGLRIAPYAHNEFINMACETGAVGMTLVLWFTFLLTKQLLVKREDIKIWGKWGAVSMGILVQSLFDFNLHYPSILLIFIFFISFIVPKREVMLGNRKLKILAVILIGAYGVVAALPGIADILFRNANNKGTEGQMAAAQISARIDFFNGIYRYRTGRMRDLLIAIDLEPRNVWYRREAARYFMAEWERTSDVKYLRLAKEQYNQILKFAPGVQQFFHESGEILETNEAG